MKKREKKYLKKCTHARDPMRIDTGKLIDQDPIALDSI